MNRRQFIVTTTTTLASVSSGVAGEKELPKSAYYKIVMVDPRGRATTKDTHPIGFEKQKADVMGSLSLSREESAKLKRILNSALTSSDNVPFCGHAPAYVIVQMDAGKAVSFVSVCGLCKTWCGPNGDLRVLDDGELMPFLTKALPLPPAFSKVKALPDLMDMDQKTPFLDLPSNS